MSLTSEEVVKIAKLARIKLDKEEIESYKDELSKILAIMKSLKEVDTDNIEPMISTISQPLRLEEDNVTIENIVDQIVKNAPAQQLNCFVVPKVVE